jgi:hypothetical protein
MGFKITAGASTIDAVRVGHRHDCSIEIRRAPPSSDKNDHI